MGKPNASVVHPDRTPTVERALRGVQVRAEDFPGLGVAYLPDQNDIRVVSQKRTQAASEAHSNLVVHLYLGDAFDLILNGVFDGDDLAALVVGGIQGGAGVLSRAGSQRERELTKACCDVT